MFNLEGYAVVVVDELVQCLDYIQNWYVCIFTRQKFTANSTAEG